MESSMTHVKPAGRSAADDVAQRYATLIEERIRPYSPLYATLAEAVRDDEQTCARLAELSPHRQLPGFLFAVVRLVTGSVPVDGADLLGRLRDRWDEIGEQLRTRELQGNEVGRCAPLLLGLDRVPGPIALIEVGTSAGLCLRLDGYHYTFRRGTEVVELGGDSAVRIDCEVRGSAPLPSALPEIVWRAGLDRSPISVHDEQETAWLDCSIFADATDRRQRLAAALAEARRDPPLVVTGDLVDDLAELAAQAPRDARLVIIHSATLPHAEGDRPRRFIELADSLGATRVGVEAAHALAELGIGPELDPTAAWARNFWVTAGADVIAVADPLGAWVDSPPPGGGR